MEYVLCYLGEPVMNSLFSITAYFRSFIISFVKKVPRTNQKEAIAKKLSITINAIVLPGIKKIPRRSTSMPDFTVIEMEARKEQACLTRRGERIL